MEDKTKEEKNLDDLFGSSPDRQLKLSYSRVSDFDRNGPKCLIKRTFVENDGAKIGSITDDLLYTKLVDKNYFNRHYYRYDNTKPTATTLKLCNIITSNLSECPTHDEVFTLVKANKLWSGTSDDEKLKAKYETKQFWDYIEAFYESKSKTIVSTPEYLLGDDLVNTLLTHEHSRDIFDNSCSNIYQHPITFNLNGFIFRGILDIMRINHEDKTVRMIDLKTGQEDAQNFMKSYLKWRYDLQESVYTAAFDSICKELGLVGYTLLPFEFLYISRYEKIPLVYEVSKKWHEATKLGFTTLSGWKYRGLIELIETIKWHWDNKVFDMTRKLHEANGRAVMDDSFINLN
jgi:hypothetical protein